MDIKKEINKVKSNLIKKGIKSKLIKYKKKNNNNSRYNFNKYNFFKTFLIKQFDYNNSLNKYFSKEYKNYNQRIKDKLNNKFIDYLKENRTIKTSSLIK